MRLSYIIVVLVVLAVGIGFAPYMDGYAFKQNLTDLITAINQEKNYPIKIEIVDYQLGWMRSKAKIRITPMKENIDPNARKFLPQEIIVEDDIAHGPLVYDKLKSKYVMAYAIVDSRVITPESWRPILLDKQNPVLTQTHSLVSYNGVWQQQTHISSVVIQGVGTLRFQAYTSELKISVENDHIKKIHVNGNMGAIALEGESSLQRLTIQPASYQYTASPHEKGLWDSKADIRLSGIVMQMTGGNTFTLSDIHLSTSKGYSAENLYSGNVQLTIQKLAIPNPVVPEVSSFNVSLSINNLSAQGMSDYLNFIKTRQLKILSQEEMQTVENLIAHMVTATSTLIMEVGLDSPLGRFASHVSVFWQADLPVPASFDDVLAKITGQMNMRVAAPLIQKVLESAFIKLDERLAQTQGQSNGLPSQQLQPNPADRAKGLLDTWQQEGLFIKDKNDYVTSITVSGGVMKVNGKVMDEKLPIGTKPDATK